MYSQINCRFIRY